jgi:pyruvate formate-lyase/glycerol dehydratase family glycyl radical enzyme
MSLSNRVRRLRAQSLAAPATLSAERAQLMTEFYQQESGTVSTPVHRALAFQYLMEKKEIFIGDGELIVGERGPAPKATPTFPEICCHSLEDLDLLDSREKISFGVTDDVRNVFREQIIPFWAGKSIRGLIFEEMTDEWEAAYDAGVFTEFMEQRAPGHTVLDNKIYSKGLLDLKQDIAASRERLDYLNDPQAYAKQEQLKAMSICAYALIHYAGRYAQFAQQLAETVSDPRRRGELRRIADVCRNVPANPPRNFWEALQYYWFVHVGVITELNTWDSFSPGRLDQHLYPFYRKGLDNATLTEDRARELLQCFWIKFNNHPAPPKVGVTAEESGTYTDFAQINTGGVKEDGSDAVNDLTYLILDVIEEMRLLQPSSSVQLSKKNPDRLLKRAAKIINTGFGQPSIFNTDVIVQELIRQGKSVADARNGGSSGCVEVGAFGKENYNLTGYFNMPKVLEITLNSGRDPRTGQLIGIDTGDATEFNTFDELMDAYRKQLNHFVDIKIRGNNIIERLWAQHLPTPVLSLLVDDCIANRKDYHDGGARYNTSYIQGVGLGTLTDAVTAMKFHVFDEGTFTMADLLQALHDDFEGHESVRLTLLERTPKFGNDDDYTDSIMRELFEAYFNAIDGRQNTRGGTYHINLLPTTVHIYFGSVMNASPDGRRAGEPLSEGVSPVQGADRYGPTAVLKSVAKIDHARTGGTLLNQKLTPGLLDQEDGLSKFVSLVRSYFRMDGHHIQFNVVDADTLRAAQEEPEKHRDLIVRVAGYSDYFCDLGKTLQDEIIARTEHQDF